MSFVTIIIAASLVDLTFCGLTLTKDRNDKFYYTVNGKDYPVDFDIGAEIAGLQEKIMLPRETSNEEEKYPDIVNVSKDLGWGDEPALIVEKRSAKQGKIGKKIEKEERVGKDGNKEDDVVKAEEYEYVDDDVGVDNDDVYADELVNNENEEGSELLTARSAISNRNNRHRQTSHVKACNDRPQQHQYADEYYEEYDDESANRKSKRVGTSRNTRYDVMRR